MLKKKKKPLQENCKRSGQIHIPAFGNWDYANDTPITQYFECARQAGLLRYSSSSGESDPYVRGTTTAGGGDLYAVDDHRHHRHLHKPSRYHAAVAPPRKVSFFYPNKIFLFNNVVVFHIILFT